MTAPVPSATPVPVAAVTAVPPPPASASPSVQASPPVTGPLPSAEHPATAHPVVTPPPITAPPPTTALPKVTEHPAVAPPLPATQSAVTSPATLPGPTAKPLPTPTSSSGAAQLAAAATTASTPVATSTPSAAPLPADNTPTVAVKSFTMKQLAHDHYEILHKNQPFLWSSRTHHSLSPDEIRLAKDAAGTQIIVTLKANPAFGGPRVLLGGNPDTTDKQHWEEWPARSDIKLKHYDFCHQKRSLVWRHEPKTTRHVEHYRLYDHGNGKWLATCTQEFDQIDFFEQLGEELELLSLMAMSALNSDRLKVSHVAGFFGA